MLAFMIGPISKHYSYICSQISTQAGDFVVTEWE